MSEDNKNKYDLEERTFRFAKRVIMFYKKLKKTVENLKLIDQVIRVAGSIGSKPKANRQMFGILD